MCKSVVFARVKLAAVSLIAIAQMCIPNHAFAIAGIQSADNKGQIGQAHIDFAAPLGKHIGFINMGEATGTGTFVPSTTPGQFKFLTAAHNVVDDKTKAINVSENAIIHFGATPGLEGKGATYSVKFNASQVAVNSPYVANGQASDDLAVITFTLNDISVVKGGDIIEVLPVITDNPLNMQGVVAGHGLHGDGTVALGNGHGPNNDVDGILKGGTNIIDFYGDNSDDQTTTGIVAQLDFDNPNDPKTSTYDGKNSNPKLEAGTASGDSGSALLVDVDGDGVKEIVGVLNSGYNPLGADKASEFGDISTYAPVSTASNQAFLKEQGVFVGQEHKGVKVANTWTIVDLTAMMTVKPATLSPQMRKFVADSIKGAKLSVSKTTQFLTSRHLRSTLGMSVLDMDCATYQMRTCSAVEFFTYGQVDLNRFARNQYPNFQTNNRKDSINIGGEARLSDNFLGGAALSTGHSNVGAGRDLSATGYVIGKYNNITASAFYNFSKAYANSRQAGWSFSGTNVTSTIGGRISGNFVVRNISLQPYAAIKHYFTTIDHMELRGMSGNSIDDKRRYQFGEAEAGVTVSLENFQVGSATIKPFFGGAFLHRYDRARPTAVKLAAGSSASRPFYKLTIVGGKPTLVNLDTELAGPATNGTTNANANVDTTTRATFGRITTGFEAAMMNGLGMSVHSYANINREGVVELGANFGLGIKF